MNATMPDRSSHRDMAARRGRRARWLLIALLAYAGIAMLLLATVLAPPGPGADPVSLELASSAGEFRQQLAADWLQQGHHVCGIGDAHDASGASVNRLRCHLFVDSIGLVPGYVGLLLFFTFALCRVAGLRGPLAPHLLGVPIVAAGLFDVAENGMAQGAADDWLHAVLADAAVLDVRSASVTKWGLLALAVAVLALLSLRVARLAWHDPRNPHHGLGTGPLLALATFALALGAVCMGVGPLLRLPAPTLMIGMAATVLACALLAWWQLRGELSRAAQRRD